MGLTSRRLHTSGHSTSPVGIFRVSFVVYSSDTPVLGDSLSRHLQSELKAARAGVEIESAHVDWPDLVRPQASVDDEASNSETALLLGVAVGAVVLAVVLAACVGVAV